MDLIKTGKYIADKRKSLGLTQKQVAEKLGMSDKSVSKWERGVSPNKRILRNNLCLPACKILMYNRMTLKR